MRRAAEWQGAMGTRMRCATSPRTQIRGALHRVGGSLPQIRCEWRAARRHRRLSGRHSHPLAWALRRRAVQGLALVRSPPLATMASDRLRLGERTARPPGRAGRASSSIGQVQETIQPRSPACGTPRAERRAAAVVSFLRWLRCGPAAAGRARGRDSIEGQCRPAGRLVPRQEPGSDITT